MCRTDALMGCSLPCGPCGRRNQSLQYEAGEIWRFICHGSNTSRVLNDTPEATET